MRRKYGNQPTMIHGIRFDSKAEAMRYMQLLSQEQAGEIEDLELQPKYRLEVNGNHICNYIGDFRYTVAGLIVVEDVKGVRTREFILKSKLMKAIYGIAVKEVKP